MKLLLDTHTVLWWAGHDPRLTDSALDELIDDSNQLLLSAVVAWEIGVKSALGKLRANDALWHQLAETDIVDLPITVAHARAIEHLPRHHRDPFDRLLVAQAQIEKAVLVSSDDTLRRYDVEVLW